MHQPVPLQEGRVSSVASGPCPEAFRVCSRPLSSSLSTGCLLTIMAKICNDCSCLWILRNHHQFCLFESTQLRGSFFSNLQLLYGRCLNLQCPTMSHLARMVLAAGIKTYREHRKPSNSPPQPPLASPLSGLVCAKSGEHCILGPLCSTVTSGRSFYLRVSLLTGSTTLFVLFSPSIFLQVSAPSPFSLGPGTPPPAYSPQVRMFKENPPPTLLLSFSGGQASLAKSGPGSRYGIGSKCRHLRGGESSCQVLLL